MSAAAPLTAPVPSPAPAGARSASGARVLAVRLDSDGDVLMTGPAVLALSCGVDGGPPAAAVDVLAAPAGAGAARLLPGVDEVLTAQAPWAGYRPAAAHAEDLAAMVDLVRAGAYDEVVVFTAYHQSPLPMATVARLAGVPRVVGASEDHPGSLLDVRYRRPGTAEGAGGDHEVLAALALVAASGRAVPGAVRLAVRDDLPPLDGGVAADLAAVVASGDEGGRAGGATTGPGAGARPAVPAGGRGGRRGYVVVHPGASVPARAPDPGVAAATAAALAADGWPVVVTGGPGEEDLGARVAAAAPGALDLSGRTDLAGLAHVLGGAAAVVVGNTGPAHLAAAVGTPVASWFSTVMPPERWAPFGVPAVLLNRPGSACTMTRAQACPVPGHPCLDVDPARTLAAVEDLVAGRVPPLPPLPATPAPAHVRTTASDGTGLGAPAAPAALAPAAGGGRS